MSENDRDRLHFSVGLRFTAFALVFVVLQAVWAGFEGSQIWRTWMETLNVGMATLFINLFSPEAAAMADGTRIRAEGGGLNLLQGCDGAELLLLMTSAFVVAPLTLKWRISGWLLGLVLAWLLNVCRLVALFFTWRTSPFVFDLLHNYIGPVFLILILALYVNGVFAFAAESAGDEGATA